MPDINVYSQEILKISFYCDIEFCILICNESLGQPHTYTVQKILIHMCKTRTSHLLYIKRNYQLTIVQIQLFKSKFWLSIGYKIFLVVYVREYFGATLKHSTLCLNIIL